MLLAVIGTLLHHEIVSYEWIIVGLVIGSTIGVAMGLRVPMTAMPQRTALSHAFGALAAALVGVSEFLRHGEHLGDVHGHGARASRSCSAASPSPAASSPSRKLQELVQGQPITYKGQNVLNILLFGSAVVIFIALVVNPGHTVLFYAMVRPRARLRRAARHPDRRRRHARRHRAPELLRRPRRRRHGLRAQEQGPDHRRHARRHLRLPAVDPHVQGDEPLDHERAVRCVRQREPPPPEAARKA